MKMFLEKDIVGATAKNLNVLVKIQIETILALLWAMPLLDQLINFLIKCAQT
jgi:hypothetical protein